MILRKFHDYHDTLNNKITFMDHDIEESLSFYLQEDGPIACSKFSHTICHNKPCRIHSIHIILWDRRD
jgi:hypothetical protein